MSINLHQWRSTLLLFSILFLSLNPILSFSVDSPSPSQIAFSPSPLSDALSPSDVSVSDALSPSGNGVFNALSPAFAPSPSSGNYISDPFSPSPSSPSPSPSPSSPSPSSGEKSNSDASSPSPSPNVDNSNSPSSSPSPSPSPSSLSSPADALTPFSSPSPSPDASDVDDIAVAESRAQTDASKKSDGRSSGHKAGVAFGVIGAACVVGFAGWIYKKRQDNVRRSQYGYNARTTMI